MRLKISPLSLTGALVAIIAASQAKAATASFQIYDTSEQTAVTSPGYTGSAYASITSVTFDNAGAPQSFYAFCIDVDHQIGTTASDLSYVEEPLATFVYGTDGNVPLSTPQVQEIGELASYGASLTFADAGAPSLDAQLAGVQDAIWTIEYPNTSSYSFTADDPAAASDAASDVKWVESRPLSTATYYAIVPSDGGQTQGFVVAGVPEPAGWALMMLGMGLVGASMRRGARSGTIRAT